MLVAMAAPAPASSVSIFAAQSSPSWTSASMASTGRRGRLDVHDRRRGASVASLAFCLANLSLYAAILRASTAAASASAAARARCARDLTPCSRWDRSRGSRRRRGGGGGWSGGGGGRGLRGVLGGGCENRRGRGLRSQESRRGSRARAAQDPGAAAGVAATADATTVSRSLLAIVARAGRRRWRASLAAATISAREFFNDEAGAAATRCRNLRGRWGIPRATPRPTPRGACVCTARAAPPSPRRRCRPTPPWSRVP